MGKKFLYKNKNKRKFIYVNFLANENKIIFILKGKQFTKTKNIHSGSAIITAQPFQIQNIKEENYVNRKNTKRLFKRS